MLHCNKYDVSMWWCEPPSNPMPNDTTVNHHWYKVKRKTQLTWCKSCWMLNWDRLLQKWNQPQGSRCSLDAGYALVNSTKLLQKQLKLRLTGYFSLFPYFCFYFDLSFLVLKKFHDIECKHSFCMLFWSLLQ